MSGKAKSSLPREDTETLYQPLLAIGFGLFLMFMGTSVTASFSVTDTVAGIFSTPWEPSWCP